MQADATERFTDLVQRADSEIPLDEAALLIAAHGCPDLEVNAELAVLDDLAAGCAQPSFTGLVEYLFGQLGFAGNTDDYRDPRNSFLNEVVRRRTGIPISLSVLTIEIGRRIGVPLAGVGMPGHFLVRHEPHPSGAQPPETGSPVFVDPFHGGQVLDEAACRDRFHAVMGPDATFRADYLTPVGPRAILDRMLANLEATYLARGTLDELVWVLALRSTFPGAARRN